MGEIGRSLLRGVLVGWLAAVAALALVLIRAAVGPSPRPLVFPVPAAPPGELGGHFDEARGDRRHRAVDIAAPRGARVVAVERGTVARLGSGGSAGLSIDLLGRSGRRCYFYAHLESTAPGLAAGTRVERGQSLGTVGTTGNAPEDAPHLHFAVRRLAAGESCGEGDPVDPAPLLEGALRTTP